MDNRINKEEIKKHIKKFMVSAWFDGMKYGKMSIKPYCKEDALNKFLESVGINITIDQFIENHSLGKAEKPKFPEDRVEKGAPTPHNKAAFLQ